VGRFDVAEQIAARAREMAPDSQDALVVGLWIPMFRDGNFEPAQRALNRWLSERKSRWGQNLFLLDLPEQALALVAADQIEASPIQRAMILAHAHFALGHHLEARTSFDVMLREIESHQKESMTKGQMKIRPALHNRLSIAYAGLGRAEEAFAELGKVAQSRRSFLWLQTMVATVAGRYDEAFVALGELLDRPSHFTVAYLRASRFYAPLRKDPRFEALLAKHEKLRTP